MNQHDIQNRDELRDALHFSNYYPVRQLSSEEDNIHLYPKLFVILSKIKGYRESAVRRVDVHPEVQNYMFMGDHDDDIINRSSQSRPIITSEQYGDDDINDVSDSDFSKYKDEMDQICRLIDFDGNGNRDVLLDAMNRLYQAYSDNKEFSNINEAFIYLLQDEDGKLPFINFDYEDYYDSVTASSFSVPDADVANIDQRSTVRRSHRTPQSLRERNIIRKDELERRYLDQWRELWSVLSKLSELEDKNLNRVDPFYIPKENIQHEEEDDRQRKANYFTADMNEREIYAGRLRLLKEELRRRVLGALALPIGKDKSRWYKILVTAILMSMFFMFAIGCAFQTMGAVAEFLSGWHISIVLFALIVVIVGVTTALCNYDFADMLPREFKGLWNTVCWLLNSMWEGIKQKRVKQLLVSSILLVSATAMSISVGMVFYSITELGIHELLTQGFLSEHAPTLVSALMPCIPYLAFILGIASFAVMGGITCRSLFDRIKNVNKSIVHDDRIDVYNALNDKALYSVKPTSDNLTELYSREESEAIAKRTSKNLTQYIGLTFSFSLVLVLAMLSFTLSPIIFNIVFIASVVLFAASMFMLAINLALSQTTWKENLLSILQNAVVFSLFFLISFSIWNLGMAAMPLVALHAGVTVAWIVQILFFAGISPFSVKVARAAFDRYFFSVLFRKTLGGQLSSLWSFLVASKPFGRIPSFLQYPLGFILFIVAAALLTPIYIVGVILTGLFFPVSDPAEHFNAFVTQKERELEYFYDQCAQGSLGKLEILKRIFIYCFFKVPAFLICGFLSVIVGGGCWRPEIFYSLRDKFYDVELGEFRSKGDVFWNIGALLLKLPLLILALLVGAGLSIIQLFCNACFLIFNWRIEINAFSNAIIPVDSVRLNGGNVFRQGITFVGGNSLSKGSMGPTSYLVPIVNSYELDLRVSALPCDSEYRQQNIKYAGMTDYCGRMFKQVIGEHAFSFNDQSHYNKGMYRNDDDIEMEEYGRQYGAEYHSFN